MKKLFIEVGGTKILIHQGNVPIPTEAERLEFEYKLLKQRIQMLRADTKDLLTKWTNVKTLELQALASDEIDKLLDQLSSLRETEKNLDSNYLESIKEL